MGAPSERREAPALRMGRRMSDTEDLMWAAERDPVLRSSFLSVTICDRDIDIDRFRRRMAAAAGATPRLRQRVVVNPIGPPSWRDDRDFDLDHHVRHVALPSPGSDRQLLDLAADLFEDTFDPARPLWTFLVVEGLSDGRSALLAKFHHTITDGVGAIRLSSMYIDRAPEQDEPSLTPPPGDEARGPSPLGAVTGAVGRQVGAARSAAAAAVGLVANPLSTARTVGAMAQLDRARSPLWRRRGVSRQLEVLSFELEDVKDAAKRLGGTVNDVFVCALSDAAGAYHRARCADIDDLRMTMPINTRTERTAGGNSFVPARMLVPCGDVEPEARFAVIRSRLHRAREGASPGILGAAAGILASLPTPVVTRVARQQTGTIDFAASNVRGAPFELWIAGARILHNHPMGPTGGTAFIATILSTAGTLDLGLCCDKAAVLDPAELRDRIAAGFAALL